MNPTLATGAIACGIIAAGWGGLRVIQWVRGGGDQLERTLSGPVYELPYDVREDLEEGRV